MSFFQNVPVRSRLLGAFGVVLVILITLSSAAYRTISLNQTANDWVTHSLEVISAANGTLTTLVDMETSYRGFLLAGDDVFLMPYLQGVGDVQTEIDNLVQLTDDNPSQVARWRTIERQVADWRAQATEPGIALRRRVRDGQATQDQLNAFVATGEGRIRFAAIRASFRDAIAVEEQFLAERQREAAAAGTLLQAVLVGGAILAIAVSLALARLLTATIVGPITSLAMTAQAIAGGDVNRRVGLKRGDEIGVAAAAFDRMTEQLQATIARSEAILDTAAEGIVGLDASSRVTFANPAAVRLLDSTEDMLLGQDATGWIAAAKADADLPADDDGQHPITRAIRQAHTVTGAGDLVRPGDERPSLAIEYACSPLREYGEIRGAVLTFRDVTERRAAQRALEEGNRELARSNADLEQFAYVASHDLQEPLRAIVSYLQLLERRYAPQLDERANRYIGHAVEGGHRMQTLITDLLTYSRVGRRGEEMTPVNIRGVFDRALSNLQIAIEESEAVVTYDEPLPTVIADATQMHQLLQNLLANAIKFRGENAPRIHLWAERIDGGWRFSVRDNGIGISPEYRERVFVLFQRLHGRDEYAGTGIGLAVCKKIVERHGGQLWVESTEGGGSTFHFTIPDPNNEGAAA
ncbi:MAG: CHASE3 domain-containing protein [Chloroflexi bacterium]|nr:CHASE3 domain-containing protein [Chloroflexota bacterium]